MPVVFAKKALEKPQRTIGVSYLYLQSRVRQTLPKSKRSSFLILPAINYYIRLVQLKVHIIVLAGGKSPLD